MGKYRISIISFSENPYLRALFPDLEAKNSFFRKNPYYGSLV
jgi:hypothetical protein